MQLSALSVRQPWANLIASGQKSLEIRSWEPAYRGELLICSSKKPNIEPFGKAVVLVDLVGVHPFERLDAKAAMCDWDEGYFAWVLENPRIVEEPFDVRGFLHIYQVTVPESHWYCPTNNRLWFKRDRP